MAIRIDTRREVRPDARKRQGIAGWIVLAIVIAGLYVAAGGGAFQYAVFVCGNGICTKAPDTEDKVVDAASCKNLVALSKGTLNTDDTFTRQAYAAAGQTLGALGYHVECRGWLPVVGWYRFD
jgi:hypothetical protein